MKLFSAQNLLFYIVPCSLVILGVKPRALHMPRQALCPWDTPPDPCLFLIFIHNYILCKKFEHDLVNDFTKQNSNISKLLTLFSHDSMKIPQYLWSSKLNFETMLIRTKSAVKSYEETKISSPS